MQTYVVSGNVSASKRAALGRMVIHWSMLEQRVEQVIWALRGHTRKVGRPITSKTVIRTRLQTMVKEAHQRLPKKEAGVFDGLALYIEQLALERNWAVHGLWGNGSLPGTKRKTYAITYFHNPNGESREMTKAYLKSLTGRIAHQIQILDGIIKHHIGFVP